MLLHSILRFAGLLRLLDIRISTAEVIDCLEALLCVSWDDRQVVKETMKATLIKNESDISIFESAFDAFFVDDITRQAQFKSMEDMESDIQEGMRMSEEDLQFRGEPIPLNTTHKRIYAAMPPDSRRKLVEFLYKSSEGAKVDDKFAPVVRKMVEGYLERWRRSGDIREIRDPLPSTGDRDLDATIHGMGAAGVGKGGDSLLYTDLKDISEDDLEKAGLLTQALARRLAKRISRRYRLSKGRKRLDIRRTIRANIRYGGVLLNLRYRKRRPSKPKILILCDISASMKRYSRFVLEFLHGLSTVVGSIETFVFSEGLSRLPIGSYRGQEFDKVVNSVVQSGLWGGGTNIGLAVKTLITDYTESYNSSTVAIVVSDTKTVGWEESVKQLSEFRSKVKDIIWLNTIPKEEWDRLPPVRPIAGMVKMFECYTLAHLESVVKSEILLRPRATAELVPTS